MTKRANLPQFNDRLLLGKEGLPVSPFCVGIGGSPETVTAAFERGINFFFLSADMHWPLYEATRNGLDRLLARGPHVREQIVVAAACYPTQPEFCSVPFMELLEAVPALGSIDLLVAGGAYGEEFKARHPIYEQHRRAGFVGARAIGATFHERKAAADAIGRNLIDIAFIRYNPDHSGAREDVFPLIEKPSSTLLFSFNSTHGYVPPLRLDALGIRGDVYWHPAITDFYRFALSRPEIDGLLISPTTSGEILALEGALREGPLNHEEEQYLLDLSLVHRGKAHVELEDAPLPPLQDGAETGS